MNDLSQLLKKTKTDEILSKLEKSNLEVDESRKWMKITLIIDRINCDHDKMMASNHFGGERSKKPRSLA